MMLDKYFTDPADLEERQRHELYCKAPVADLQGVEV